MLRKVWKSIAIRLLILVMTFEYGEVSFSPKLRNMAAVVGSKMKISCVSNSSERVYWYHVKNKVTDVGAKINNVNGVILPDFSNFVATGEILGQALETNSIRSENAGLLQCKTSGYEFDAQLTVLNTDPTCNVMSKEIPTRDELCCSVGFSGFWPPTMEWIRKRDNTKMDGHPNITTNKVTLTMPINANNTDVSAEYYCLTFFSNETRPSSGAANIPDYNYPCSPTNNMASATVATDGSNANGGYVIWVITGFAGAACVVVLAVIIVFLKRNPEVCRKSSEPDIMQLADVVQNADINMVMENGVIDHREDEVDEEPEQPGGVRYQNRVYAEVEVCDRGLLPPYMYDSPAWSESSGNKNDCRGKGIQYSPACSHQSRTGTPRNAASRGGTPRSESPNIAIENVEYLDINSVATIPTPQMQRTQQMPRRPPARLPPTSNKFQPAMYASIDHTSRPPPPLPPSDDYSN